ncbi:MAG: preprotein translocase subunit SecG [Bacteroidales bacterium]|nr:preprotein translocase subunit SecG [Bacteroidales bacterium]
MTSFLIVLAVFIIIISIALGFFVLIQESKGGGLTSNFAGSNQIMGVRKTTNIVEIITWSLAGLIFVLCLACAFICKSEYNDIHQQAQPTEQAEE